MNRSERQRLFSLSTIVTQERTETPSLQQVAGMTQPELLYSWSGEGMTWYFRESLPDAPMILTLDAILQGDLLPPLFSEYTRAMSGEAPPTEYAKKNRAEDFAESVMEYFVRRTIFERECPARAWVIERIITDDEYTG